MAVKTVTLVRVAIVVAAVAIVSGLGLICLPGCVVVPARYETDAQGKRVMVEPERVVPAPIVVNTYPTPMVYDYVPPVIWPTTFVVDRPYYPTYQPVTYFRSYYAPPVYYRPSVAIYSRPSRAITVGPRVVTRTPHYRR